jgi:hypothetical protein
VVQAHWLDAALASWLPNIVFAGLSVGLALAAQKRIPA